MIAYQRGAWAVMITLVLVGAAYAVCGSMPAVSTALANNGSKEPSEMTPMDTAGGQPTPPAGNAGSGAADQVTWGKAAHSLRLGLSAGPGRAVTIYLENVGKQPLEVFSYVQAEEVHLDWFSLRLTDAAGANRELHFTGDRERAVEIKATLAPRGQLSHSVDLAAWEASAVNGTRPIAPGTYRVTGIYEVGSAPDGIWKGHIKAGPIPLKLATP